MSPVSRWEIWWLRSQTERVCVGLKQLGDVGSQRHRLFAPCRLGQDGAVSQTEEGSCRGSVVTERNWRTPRAPEWHPARREGGGEGFSKGRRCFCRREISAAEEAVVRVLVVCAGVTSTHTRPVCQSGAPLREKGRGDEGELGAKLEPLALIRLMFSEQAQRKQNATQKTLVSRVVRNG